MSCGFIEQITCWIYSTILSAFHSSGTENRSLKSHSDRNHVIVCLVITGILMSPLSLHRCLPLTIACSAIASVTLVTRASEGAQRILAGGIRVTVVCTSALVNVRTSCAATSETCIAGTLEATRGVGTCGTWGAVVRRSCTLVNVAAGHAVPFVTGAARAGEGAHIVGTYSKCCVTVVCSQLTFVNI